MNASILLVYTLHLACGCPPPGLRRTGSISVRKLVRSVSDGAVPQPAPPLLILSCPVPSPLPSLQLREGVLYLLAMGLRHLQQSTTQQLYAARGNASASPAAAGGRSDGGSNVATGSSPTGAGKDVSQQAGTPSKTGSIGAGASNSSMSPSKGASAALGSGGRSAGAAAGAAAAAAGVATHLAVRSKKDAEVLLELGERVARLPSLPGTDSEDAAKYTRAAATSMLALLDQVQSRAGASAGSGGGGGGSHGGAPPGLAELLGSKRWSQALSGLEGVAQGV